MTKKRSVAHFARVRQQTHDFSRLLFADGELVVGPAANVKVVDVTGVDERDGERIGDAALLTLTYHKRTVVTARLHQRLGRLTRDVSNVPRLSTQLPQLQCRSSDHYEVFTL